MASTNTTGTLPTRNWTQGELEGFKKINAEAVKKKLVERSKACFACKLSAEKCARHLVMSL
jgi:aldehyde:ferredoxin oxidoreductase